MNKMQDSRARAKTHVRGGSRTWLVLQFDFPSTGKQTDAGC
jgi:hypothetical protein